MCLEIHLPDGRVIEGRNKLTKELHFEGDPDDKLVNCFCQTTVMEILEIVKEGLGDRNFDDYDIKLTPTRIVVERSCEPIEHYWNWPW